MTWNDTVLAHPHLSPTDKLVFHLLGRLGGDSPAVRRQLTSTLRLSDRQLRRISARLQQCGDVDHSPAPVASVDNSRTLMSAADIDDRSADTSVRSFNAPTRTLWSSSSEEDVQEKNQYPSPPPPGGARGEEVPAEFLVEMHRIWKTIAPQECEEPQDWFCTLHREFGPQIPLMVLRQFALGDRTLSHLRHPSSYKSYFVCCCRRAQEEALALPRHHRPTPEENRLLTAADYDLNDF
ncbi:MAG: hypothetical protein IT369_00475 [Candidatus Latescibacteria bacterium]|nr:hypothetical protein [Candidatus Latescibacterota bacterium]